MNPVVTAVVLPRPEDSAPGNAGVEIPPVEERLTVPAVFALMCLLVVFILALIPTLASPLADKSALLFLAGVAALAFWTPFSRRLEKHSCAVPFFLTSVMFIIYRLAREAGPQAGPALRFTALPGDEFVVPYAAYVAFVGGLAAFPLRWQQLTVFGRALLTGLLLIGLLAAYSFWLLAWFYAVGVTATLDPSRLPTLFMMLFEFAYIALICHTVCENAPARRLTMRVLPVVLLLLWARHHFVVTPEEAT